MRVKEAGKIKSKVDIYTLAHFKVLFLCLDNWNVNKLEPKDIKLHKDVYSEVS